MRVLARPNPPSLFQTDDTQASLCQDHRRDGTPDTGTDDDDVGSLSW
jgi:hypothetical protein